jgi:hypothetical protein
LWGEVGGGEGVSAVCITIIAKNQYTKVSRKLVTEKFKNKREIGADKGEITRRFNNCKFIKISAENTYRRNNKTEYKERK